MVDRQFEEIAGPRRAGARHQRAAAIERHLHELQVRVVRRGVEVHAGVAVTTREQAEGYDDPEVLRRLRDLGYIE